MIEIRGADQLAALSKRLKEVGDKDLHRELSKGITAAVKPLRKALQDSARSSLPARGGLNQRVARSKISTRRSSRSGVRIVAGGPRSQLSAINAGRFRHPVFGDRGTWVSQTVTSGWWDRPIDDAGPTMVREVLKAAQTVADKVNRPL